MFFRKLESEEGRTHPPERHPETQKEQRLFMKALWIIVFKLLRKENERKAPYPVGRLVAWHALWDGRSCRGIIQVGAVVIHQELVSQSVQLWGRNNS